MERRSGQLRPAQLALRQLQRRSRLSTALKSGCHVPPSSQRQATPVQLHFKSRKSPVSVSQRGTSQTSTREESDHQRVSMSPLLSQHADTLTPYEQKEIQKYSEVYYVGVAAGKVQNPTNFDNFDGEYNIIVGDHVHYRYEILGVLGRGAFGQVCRCLDHKTGEQVALKIVKNCKKYRRQAAMEVKVLMHLNTHDTDDTWGVVRMKSYFQFRNHICITFEMLGLTLYELISLHKFSGFDLKLVRRFCIQILLSLKHIGSSRVVHCDLKPENILLKDCESFDLKVIDFGSSCFVKEAVFNYIQSRFYRAPEVLLGIEYTAAIDMWSFGCIAVELFTGNPLFPGTNEADQLQRIAHAIGRPPQHVVDKATRNTHAFKLELAGTRPLSELLGTRDKLFVEFIRDILVWDPDRRLDPEGALQHPWLSTELMLRRRSKGN